MNAFAFSSISHHQFTEARSAEGDEMSMKSQPVSLELAHEVSDTSLACEGMRRDKRSCRVIRS